MKPVSIAGRRIGDGKPCYIIAEAGSNHDGRLDRALKLIDVAAAAGADAVKFQTFRARTLYPRTRVRPRYLRNLGVRKTIYETIEDMEMPFEWLPKLSAHCRRRRIVFLSTPFDEECADRLDPFVPGYKIASYELTHLPLIEHVAAFGKAVILSTGGADAAEIDRVVGRLKGVPLCLMQCTARYPAPPEAMNLRAIQTLKRRYGVPVGLSDHSTDCRIAPVAAVGLGANLLEKHFTLSRRLAGPDHSYALEPAELKELVRAVRVAESMLGSGTKAPSRAERELRDYRRGIFTLEAVAKGEFLTARNTAVLRRAGRASTGLEPESHPGMLGRRAARAMPAHRLLRPSDVA